MSAQLEAGAGGGEQLTAFHLVDRIYPSARHRCRITDELGGLDPVRFKAMRISEEVCLLIEAVVVFCRAIGSPQDREAWLEHLGVVFRDEDTRAAVGAAAERLVAQIEDGSFAEVFERIETEATKKYHRRLLGAAAYDRLATAIAKDFGDILQAAKRLIAYLKPLAIALEDAIKVIPAKTIEQSDLAFLLSRSNLKILIELDGGIDQILTTLADRKFDFHIDRSTSGLAQGELDTLTQAMRQWLTDDLRSRVRRVDRVLERKFQGASDALQHSSDGPSQASNSLVELIDRLLRSVATKDQALAWVKQHYPGPTKELSYYTEEGAEHPTKRAEVLHLVYAGLPVTEVSAFHEIVTTVIIKARGNLQGVKHADDDLAVSRALVEREMKAVHGALSIALRLAGALLSATKIAIIEDAID